jgi:hypothetical protein
MVSIFIIYFKEVIFMAKFEGKGAPTLTFEGQVGDIYTDIDTGIQYKCVQAYTSTDTIISKGDREYEWKKVEVSVELPFGEITVYSNKVYWDGNKNGKETTNVVDGDTWYYMSHQCPDVDELLAGGLIYVEGEPEPGPLNGFKKVWEDIDGWYRFNQMIYFCCNDVEYRGNTLKKGIYIPNMYAGQEWTIEFSNFNGFESIGTKTLDLKYLPMDEIIAAVKASM